MKIRLVSLFLFFCIFSTFGFEMELQVDPSEKDALPSAVAKAVDKAYNLNIKGLAFLDKRQNDAALTCFDQALDILPNYSDAINNRGVVFYRKGNIPEAGKIWEELASADPEYATASYNLGLIYFNDNELEAAGRLFDRALKANGKFVEALVRKGYIDIKLGRKDKGIENLRKAYKIAPEHQDAWGFLSHGLILTGDTLGAIEILKKKDDKPEALKQLGRIEAVRGNYDKAAGYFTKAVNLGADPSLIVELASAQLESGKARDALTVLKPYLARSIHHDPDAWLTAGIAAKECGDISGAANYFEQGVKENPHDAIMKYNLGQVYFHQKKFDEADAMWDGLSDTIQDPSLLYLRALNARRRNNPVESERLVRKALAMDERGEFYDLLGVLAHQRSDNRAAQEYFRQALKIDPNLRSAQMNLALCTKTPQELSSTARRLEQQLSSCSGDSCPNIAFQLALIYYQQRDMDKAIKTLQSLKESDKDERIYRHLAIFYREQHDWDKAIKTLETAAAKLVLEPQTEYELAEICLLGGYYAKAVERFQILIPKWNQNTWRLYYQLGYAYLEMNDLDKAKESFQKSLNSKSDNVAARGLLAFVYNRKGDAGQARVLWEKNLKDDPENPAIWINMGLSFEKDGKYDRALDYYKKAQSLDPGNKGLQINIGNACVGLEKYTEAMDAYTQALSSDKKDLAAYNIFLLSQKKRDRERAGKMLKMLEQEFPSSDFTKRVRAETALWDGDTAKAVSIFQGLTEKDAGDWLSLAKVYAARGNRDEAMKCLSRLPDDAQFDKAKKGVLAQLSFLSGNYSETVKLLKESDDTSLATQYNIALSAYSAKQYDQALSLAERLCRNATGQDRTDLCRLAGNSAFALKQWDKARQYYLQLSSFEGSNSVVQYNLAVAAYNLGDVEGMWKYYSRARELDNTIYNKDIEARYGKISGGPSSGGSVQKLDSVELWYNQAVDFQNAGKDTAAELLYKKVVAKNPQQNQAWNNLGAIYGARGDIENAEKAYQKALEKQHDIPETYANLINLYIVLEDFTKARQWLIKGLGHNPDSELLAGLRDKIADEEKKAQKKNRK